MAKNQKIGIGLIPKKPTVQEVETYITELSQHFPHFQALILPRRRDENFSGLINNPNVEFVFTKKSHIDVVASGYCLMAAARADELDWLFFNVGIKRYSPEIFAAFIKEGLRASCNLGQMVFCSPPDIRPDKANANEMAALKHDAIRKRILIDTVINYVFSRALSMPYSNINAGLFGVRRDAIKYLLSVGDYNDSSLLCSQILWHLKRSGGEDFVIKSIPVDNINMDHLSFSQEKAVAELTFVFKEAGKAGRWISPRHLVSDFFAEKASFNRWVTKKDEDWFFSNIVPPLEKALNQ
ncbi:MAG: hypothetical protein V1661_02060 [bacterium]